MAEMSPIDLLRRYDEHRQELRPLLLALLKLPREAQRDYSFVLQVQEGGTAHHIAGPLPVPGGSLRLWVEGEGVRIEIGLHPLIAWLMGDRLRRHATPWFKAVYILLSATLMLIVASLMWHGVRDLCLLLLGEEQNRLGAFSAIVFLTLALAVFDLGKTILEEEVLLHKDIFRHSTIRRTITRFIAAILIAVSIEGLLLLFKGSLGQLELLWPAVGVMGCAIGLLLALGLYVFLGAKAEASLVQASRHDGPPADAPPNGKETPAG